MEVSFLFKTQFLNVFLFVHQNVGTKDYVHSHQLDTLLLTTKLILESLRTTRYVGPYYVLETPYISVFCTIIIYVWTRWMPFDSKYKYTIKTLYCVALYSVVLRCVALHCAVYCTVLHCTALHCTVLHCTALHCCIVLYCIVLYCWYMWGLDRPRSN